jgi:two-component system nitrate/nitrite response regulator NarL
VSQTTVVLAEDQPPVRSAVRRLLEADGFAMVAEADDADGAIEAVLAQAPDVCVVEVLLPGGGIRATREITRRAPQTTVVMLAASADREHLIDSIRAGASGYLLKDMDPERLTSALRRVLAGEPAIPRALMGHLIDDLRTHGRRRTVVGKRGRAELTSREFEVLELLCDGLETARIAERLSISGVTVRRHISEVVRKLGVRNRDEAVALVSDTL